MDNNKTNNANENKEQKQPKKFGWGKKALLIGTGALITIGIMKRDTIIQTSKTLYGRIKTPQTPAMEVQEARENNCGNQQQQRRDNNYRPQQQGPRNNNNN